MTAVMFAHCVVVEAMSYNRRRHDTDGDSMQLGTKAMLFILIAALFSSSMGAVQPAQAASACQSDQQLTVPDWNTTVQRTALVPFSGWGMPYMYGDVYEEEDERDSGKQQSEYASEQDPDLHPEEPWLYNPTRPLPTLDPLTVGQYTNFQVGNDSSGMLRFNLSSAHRTTFCVSVSELIDNQTVPAKADIYLMTSSQYNSYEEVYRMMHGGWWWDDLDLAGGDSDLLSDVPPEWRSFNPLGWQSYRDVHQYESTEEVTFSVAMDAPEVYNSLFGGAEWQDFYLVIDAWDNTNDGDAGPINGVLVADVTVIPVERTVLLPPWTVPLTLFVALAAVVVVPVVLNRRYMDAGLGTSTPVGEKSVPFLEQASASDAEE